MKNDPDPYFLLSKATLSDPSLLHIRVPIMNDFSGFTMGSIGESGLVFACPSHTPNPSLINFKPFDHWAGQSEWSLALKDGEDAMCVAAGILQLRLLQISV